MILWHDSHVHFLCPSPHVHQEWSSWPSSCAGCSTSSVWPCNMVLRALVLKVGELTRTQTHTGTWTLLLKAQATWPLSPNLFASQTWTWRHELTQTEMMHSVKTQTTRSTHTLKQMLWRPLTVHKITHTLKTLISNWSPGPSPASVLPSTLWCTTWCPPGTDTLCVASCTHTVSHRLTDWAQRPHQDTPQPLCKHIGTRNNSRNTR